MKKPTKIFGPPGTGKTTRLLQIIEEQIAAGVRPERIAFLTFTKRAAEVGIERAQLRFNLSKDQFPWFRTIHSMAFQDIHASRDDIMQEEQFQELGRKLGFKFTKIDQELQMPMGTALGDRLMRIEHLARLRKVSLEQQYRDSQFPDVIFPQVLQWVDMLAKYKQKHALLDYTDLLERFNTELDVDVVIVDEAQDLSMLQWDVIRKAAANAKQVYLAGDDDQCIYGWAGADVDYFLRINAHINVLPTSYRLPQSVFAVANSVLANISRRQPKEWASRAEKGAVNWLSNETLLDLQKGTWLLIARNHRFLPRFERMLKTAGYPYTKEGKHSTNTPETKAIIAWERWRKGEALNLRELKGIKAVMPALSSWNPTREVLLKDAPLPSAIKRLTWMDALQIDPIHREYIRACRANREPLTGDTRITVSTIHKVKGAEADHVALITDLTEKPWRQLVDDEEQRVLYVGLTRARQSLSIIRPQTERSYRL